MKSREGSEVDFAPRAELLGSGEAAETGLLASHKGSRDDAPLLDKPAEPLGKVESDEARNARIVMGIGYMLAMGVCGVVLVAIGSTLDDLAAKCGYLSTEVGTVFIARGIGAVVGAISSAKLYMWVQGNHVMSVSLGIITILICALPFNTSYLGLHFYFLLLGLGTGEAAHSESERQRGRKPARCRQRRQTQFTNAHPQPTLLHPTPSYQPSRTRGAKL